jgi:Ca2+-binding EF-hand superfamily protein
VGEKWNIAMANQLLRAALAEIDELGDKLSPARAEALLDEFEHDISGAFSLRDMSAVMAHCQTYTRRFRALSEEKD